ncbi:hypothetical protein GCM10009813_23870 [Brevibacterium marinum]
MVHRTEPVRVVTWSVTGSCISHRGSPIVTWRQSCRAGRDLQAGHGVEDEGEGDEEDEARDELDGCHSAEAQIHHRGVVRGGDDEFDELGVAFGQEAPPEEVGQPAQGAEEPRHSHGEREDPDRQGEDGFEQQVQPPATVGHGTDPPAESAVARTMGNLGDGGAPLPGSGPGQVRESGRHEERQRQQQGTEPDDEGGDRDGEQRDEDAEPDE